MRLSNEEVNTTPNRHEVKLDFGLRKGITVLALFAVLFVIPVTIYQNAARNSTIRVNQASVQGVSTTATTTQTKAATTNTNSLTFILLGTGGALLLLPVVFVILKKSS